MKNSTKKLALGLLATGTILSLGITQTSAFGGGQGGGQGQGLGRYVTAEEREKLQSMSPTERQEYIQQLREKYNYNLRKSSYSRGQGMKRGGQGTGRGQGKGNGQGQGQAYQSGHNEDPSALVDNIPASEVSETEKEILINQYGEEKMARDLYAYAAEKYPNVNTFSNITKSEQQHMDALKVLLDRYNIEAPTDYAKDNDLYVTLKNKIDLSEKDAIEVGMMVEMVDIDNIAEDIRNTDNDDFKVVLTNIGGASYNHLKGFVNALKNNGYTTDLEWTKYISEDDLNARGNELKTRLAEKLEEEGVELPEQATSKYLNQNCNHGNTNGNNLRGQGRGKQMMQNMNQNVQKYVNQTKVQKYKTLIEDKYAAKLDSFSQEKLEELNTKIDDLIEKIANSTSYSDTKKQSYVNVLLALKASIIDRLEESSTDMIDDLLQ